MREAAVGERRRMVLAGEAIEPPPAATRELDTLLGWICGELTGSAETDRWWSHGLVTVHATPAAAAQLIGTRGVTSSAIGEVLRAAAITRGEEPVRVAVSAPHATADRWTESTADLPEIRDAAGAFIRVLCARMLLEPDDAVTVLWTPLPQPTNGDITWRCEVIPADARSTGALIGPRGVVAGALRTLLKSFIWWRGCRASVDLRVSAFGAREIARLRDGSDG